MEIGIAKKAMKGSLGWWCKPQIPILTLSLDSLHALLFWDPCMSKYVKIGICGLHHHPSDPFLFHGFFSDPYFHFKFSIFLSI